MVLPKNLKRTLVMRIRYLFGILLVFAFAAASVPLPSSLICFPGAAFLTPTAQAAQIRAKIRSLLDRVLGRSMPDGIYKTNGRIEATQVVVAAKISRAAHRHHRQ